jgi:hypothetical protein
MLHVVNIKSSLWQANLLHKVIQKKNLFQKVGPKEIWEKNCHEKYWLSQNFKLEENFKKTPSQVDFTKDI